MIFMETDDRYSRQVMFAGFGKQRQEKLQLARVFIAGAGGLGSPVIQYLAGCGVGELVIADFDKVELSNLHRQTIFNESQIGQFKSFCSALWVKQFNASIKVSYITERITSDYLNLMHVNFDVVIDATDNLETRYVLDSWCGKRQIPLIYGGVSGTNGQLSVFHFPNSHNEKFSFQDVFPIRHSDSINCNCVTEGVIGTVPGIVGIYQAMEAIKIITGIGEIFSGILLHINTITGENKRLRIHKTKLESEKIMEDTCVQELEINEFMKGFEQGIFSFFVDVREENELPDFPFENVLRIPLSEIQNSVHLIPSDANVVLVCNSGLRSLNACRILNNLGNFEKLFSLKGGLLKLLSVNK